LKCFELNGKWSPKSTYLPSNMEKADQRARRSNYVWKDLTYGIVKRKDLKIEKNEVLIKVGSCGVCGSDIHAIQMDSEGYTKFPGHLRLPVIMGHEFSGEIVETGKDIKNFKTGDLIAVEQIHWCGECPACRIGMFNNCHYMEELGLSKDGAFSEYAVVPEKYCCNINDIAELLGDKLAALEAGALSEPFGVAYNGMIVCGGGVKPGTHVAVFGAGPIGLSVISLARAAGAAQIFAFDVATERLAFARIAGANHTYNPIELNKQNSSPSEVVLDNTKGIGCHMVVEAAGNPKKTYSEIVKMMSINAMVVQIGMSGDMPALDLTPFQLKLSRLCGTNGTAGNNIIPSVINLMAQGQVDMRKIISGRYNLDNTEDAIKDAGNGKPGKILISQHYK